MRRKITMLFVALLACVGVVKAQATMYEVGEATTQLKDGKYVLVAKCKHGVGPCYYDPNKPAGRPYRYDLDATVSVGGVVESKYVWIVDETTTEGVQSITITSVDDSNVFFPIDEAKNKNFTGTTIASLLPQVKTINGVDYIALTLENAEIGYIHANAPGGDPNLSYWNEYGDDGTCVKFTFHPVTESADGEMIAAKKALSEEIAQVSATLGALPLQTENPEGAYYLTATLPGDAPVSAAIDNNPATHYGSTWSVEIGSHHYWQVDLGETVSLESFVFSYVTRSGNASNDTPTQINIKGSADGVNFDNTIVTLTKEDDDLPGYGGNSYKSAVVENLGNYRFIRFEVPSTDKNYSYPSKPDQEVTIAIAEFRLFVGDESMWSEKDRVINAAIEAAQEVLDDENATVSELNDATVTLRTTVALAEYKAELAILKSRAEAVLSELSGVEVETAPLTKVISDLNAAITAAESNGGSTDVNVLNAAIDGLKAAIALNKNLTFHGGALASLEDGEYVIYYEDVNGNKHYMINDKADKKVVTSSVAAVYDVAWGNINDEDYYSSYTSYAYYLDMNESRISNPSKQKDKVQVENKDGNNYVLNRIWESQALYVNDEGKYAIRSTNTAGSDWAQDCFIAVSEDGLTISAQNTDLSDALYMWNVVKASEANIAFELTVDEYKYMTLFVNYAVTVPAGAKAYAVSGVENGVLALDEVGNVIPENTPVIIEAKVGNYAFTYAAPVAAYEGDNMLKGSWLDSNVAPASGYDAYVMALKGDEVVMAKAMLNEGKFINRANKAYLEIAQEVAAEAAMFSFGRGEGTTAIHNSQLTIDNVVIYDLTGRRVEKMEKGIYIVNGKKVIR